MQTKTDKKMAHIIKPKDRNAWLKSRESGIGSSEIATIIGLNPWETPYQLWRRKKGLDAPKNENFVMKAGHYLEDAVSKFFADETGHKIIKSSAGDWLIVDEARPYLRVSPDRTYWLKGKSKSKNNKGILECKTTQMHIDEDDIPKHWFCQLQYQLGVAGLETGSLAWLSSGREFGYKHLTFVKDFYDYLTEEAERFWTDYIIGDQEPLPVSVSDVIIKFNRHTDGKTVVATEELYDDYIKLKEIKEQIAELTKSKTEIEDTIKLALGDAESISYDGKTIATWRAPKPTMKFDADEFKLAHPQLAGEFTHEVQGARRFLIK